MLTRFLPYGIQTGGALAAVLFFAVPILGLLDDVSPHPIAVLVAALVTLVPIAFALSSLALMKRTWDRGAAFYRVSVILNVMLALGVLVAIVATAFPRWPWSSL